VSAFSDDTRAEATVPRFLVVASRSLLAGAAAAPWAVPALLVAFAAPGTPSLADGQGPVSAAAWASVPVWTPPTPVQVSNDLAIGNVSRESARFCVAAGSSECAAVATGSPVDALLLGSGTGARWALVTVRAQGSAGLSGSTLASTSALYAVGARLSADGSSGPILPYGGHAFSAMMPAADRSAVASNGVARPGRAGALPSEAASRPLRRRCR
jgi:hypothetical protein